MSAAQKIRRLGFRKWYERELTRCHGNLVLLVFGALGLLGCAETYTAQLAITDQLQVLGAAVASAAIAYLALRRYLYQLNHAEFVANQAVCASCATYGKWDLPADQSAGEQLHVRCRHCGHQWEIEF
jgi:hypothetical protein